jgi:hypothetical protein
MNIQMIPLNRLILSPANVRKTRTHVGIEELAASILAHGLLQNLQVRPGKGGKFEVVAGSRRHAALNLLAKQKSLSKLAEIGCNVLDDADAVEISLAENTNREPMHPADQVRRLPCAQRNRQGAGRDRRSLRRYPRRGAPEAQTGQCQPPPDGHLPRRGDDSRPVDALHRVGQSRGTGSRMGGTARL